MRREIRFAERKFDPDETRGYGSGEAEGNNEMYCVCREHVELAIDKFVDEYEDAPDLVNLQTTAFSAWTPPERCEWCENPAEILVV